MYPQHRFAQIHMAGAGHLAGTCGSDIPGDLGSQVESCAAGPAVPADTFAFVPFMWVLYWCASVQCRKLLLVSLGAVKRYQDFCLLQAIG